ncbi:MAG: Lrp/AsnC family transcriptional regulator [Desulfovibrionaceae bacterium]|nr:Lrp/AsnC family transcriptional regulator [Desulfovibrionaceae bacterium]MBF0515045.1 Lrp/AsnC family transcriptional regulator [Desulfovibrionaceae bacterium]
MPDSSRKAPELTAAQRAVLRIVQDTLPDSERPFAAIAEIAGISEDEALNLLRGLKDEGRIRRFGATLRHQRAGYRFNAMAAWRADDAEADRLAAVMTARPEVSHCYKRKTYPEWPYNLYAMIHGKSREQCLTVVEELKAATGLTDCLVLFSVQELKKTSMAYF